MDEICLDPTINRILGGGMTETIVNSYTNNRQITAAAASVAIDADGDFVVVWTSYDQDDLDGYAGVYGQRYNASGVAQGSEFQVNTTTGSNQWAGAVAADADGDFVVVWFGYGSGDADGVYGQRYNSLGTAVGSEFLINSNIGDSQG